MRFTSGRHWIVAIAILALLAMIPAYWIALSAPALGMFHDDGVYMVTAKALATGHGYRIISLPDEIPQTKYPILFPLVLSFVWRLVPDFPANGFALKLVPFGFGLLWLWLVYRLMVREASRHAAAICVVLTAVTPWTIYLSATVLSETMFAALCTGSLLLLRREEIRGTPGNEWIWAAVLAGLAVLTRTAGVSVAAAGTLYYLRGRDFRRAAGFLAVALAVCGPWFVWAHSQQAPVTDAYYSAANYTSWNIFSKSFPMDRKFTVLFLNAIMTLRSPLTIANIGSGWVDLLATVLVLLAGLRWLRKITVIEIFLGVYVAITLAWAWPVYRFLAVVYPLMLLLAWHIWTAAAPHIKAGPLVRATGLVLVAIMAALGLQQLADTARTTLKFGVVGHQDAWRNTKWQLDWIKNNTPTNAVVLSNLDPLVYLYTGRKAVRGFQAEPFHLFYSTEGDSHPIGTLDSLRNAIRNEHVNYVVRAANRTFAEGPYLDGLIADLVRTEPNRLHLVAQGADAPFQIYRVE